MPKEPTPLYNHNARKAIARQLNLTSNASGRSSYSYTSSQVEVNPVTREGHGEHEYYPVDSNMHDIDEDRIIEDQDIDMDGENRVIEVMPGIHVIAKPKAKRYENSVSFP
jgi:hypothetical protein